MTADLPTELPYVARPDAAAPAAAHPGDAGLDLAAVAPVSLPPGGWAAVDTGVAIQLPDGHVGYVCPRSGLAARHGVTVLNAPGVVDAGYTGTVKVVLINHGVDQFDVTSGMRIAQLVVARFTPVVPVAVATLDDRARGTDGFGSTGR